MKKAAKISQANGFSLVELVIAMAIAGIFAGMSIVTLGRNLNNEKLKAITRESIAWLENAKKIAIQNDFSCEIEIDNSSKTLSFPTSTTNAALDQCADLKKASLINTNTTSNTNNLKQCSKVLATNVTPEETPTTALSSLMSSDYCNDGISTTIFSPRGTLTKSVLITYEIDPQGERRCIALVAPNSLIRSGKVKGDQCDFTTAY